MHWRIQIKMFSHDGKEWHWATACICWSAEMAGIVERALAATQTVLVLKEDC